MDWYCRGANKEPFRAVSQFQLRLQTSLFGERGKRHRHGDLDDRLNSLEPGQVRLESVTLLAQRLFSGGAWRAPPTARTTLYTGISNSQGDQYSSYSVPERAFCALVPSFRRLRS